VRSHWRISVADVLPVDRRWPLALVLKAPRHCPTCGLTRSNARESDTALRDAGAGTNWQ
jgi:hypothetical protein